MAISKWFTRTPKDRRRYKHICEIRKWRDEVLKENNCGRAEWLVKHRDGVRVAFNIIGPTTIITKVFLHSGHTFESKNASKIDAWKELALDIYKLYRNKLVNKECSKLLCKRSLASISSE